MTFVRDKSAGKQEQDELEELASGGSETSTTRHVDVTDPDVGSRSRPSKNNCTSTGSDAESGEPAPSEGGPAEWRRKWWRKKNERVSEFLDRRPQQAARPVSVRDDVKIREEAAREKVTADVGESEQATYRGASWSDVLREFIGWYNGYRHANLRFRDPDGEIVRAPMQNSHQPEYGDKYYARLSALEETILDRYDNPTVAMVTLTGSSSTADGGVRCPCDHLRDVVDSWRPDRGRGVYHATRDALDAAGVDDWEYALVVENHQSGYGHVHLGIFADGDLSESDLHPVIDAHLRECDIAGPEAHDYYDPDPEARPISVNDVDPDLDPADYDEMESVGNLSSYMSEYIGAYGEELLDRSLDQLMFRAACWATGTQRVRFSTGANEMIDEARDDETCEIDASGDSLGWEQGVEAEDIEEAVSDDGAGAVTDLVAGEAGWSLDGVERVDEEGAEVFDADRTAVSWVTLDDASHLDPPQKSRFRRPERRTQSQTLQQAADD